MTMTATAAATPRAGDRWLQRRQWGGVVVEVTRVEETHVWTEPPLDEQGWIDQPAFERWTEAAQPLSPAKRPRRPAPCR